VFISVDMEGVAGVATYDQVIRGGTGYGRAQELMTAGKVDEAISIYQALVRDSPDNPVLLLNLSVAEYTGRRFREAAATATAALKLQPDLLPARLFLGASYLELGELPAAIESLKTVVAANPRERNGRLMLGLALLQAGARAIRWSTSKQRLRCFPPARAPGTGWGRRANRWGRLRQSRRGND